MHCPLTLLQAFTLLHLVTTAAAALSCNIAQPVTLIVHCPPAPLQASTLLHLVTTAAAALRSSPRDGAAIGGADHALGTCLDILSYIMSW